MARSPRQNRASATHKRNKSASPNGQHEGRRRNADALFRVRSFFFFNHVTGVTAPASPRRYSGGVEFGGEAKPGHSYTLPSPTATHGGGRD